MITTPRTALDHYFCFCFLAFNLRWECCLVFLIPHCKSWRPLTSALKPTESTGHSGLSLTLLNSNCKQGWARLYYQMQLKSQRKALWSISWQKRPRKVGLWKACRVWQQTAVITGVACNPVIFSCVHAFVTCLFLWILLHFFCFIDYCSFFILSFK